MEGLIPDKIIASGEGDAQANCARQMLMEMHVLEQSQAQPGVVYPPALPLARGKRGATLHIRTMFRLDVGLIMVKLTSLL